MKEMTKYQVPTIFILWFLPNVTCNFRISFRVLPFYEFLGTIMSLVEYFSCTFFHFEYLRSIINKFSYFFENWKMFSAPYIDFSLTEASYSSAGKASK